MIYNYLVVVLSAKIYSSVEVDVYIFSNLHLKQKAAYYIYACLFTGLVCHKQPSTLEDLENFVQFLLPGGFFCLLRAHYENSGVS